MKRVLLLPILFAILFVNTPAYAQKIALVSPAPPFFCVGNNPQPPCVTITPSTTPSQTISSVPPVSSNPVSPSSQPSTAQTNPTHAPSLNPCGQTSVHAFDNEKNEKEHKKLPGGSLSKFIELLLQLINLLLQLIGAGPIGNPVTNPPTSPVPSTAPTGGNLTPSPCPSQNPSVAPTTAPTNGITNNPTVTKPPKTPTPTLFGVSPTQKPTGKPTGPTPTNPPFTGMCSSAATKGKYQHIIWIVFENTQFSSAMSKMPYFAQIASQCGLATNFWAETHPSLPNYIAMTSGSTQGITNDSSGMLGVDNIYNQVKQKGLQWRQYAFGMPSNCYSKDSPPAPSAIYTAHHTAAIYYSNIASDCKNWDVPVGSSSKVSDTTDVTNSPLATALNTNTLPAFAIMTPTDDGGNSSVGGEVDPSLGNQFLQRWIPRITNSAAYRSGTVAIFITWDEPEDFKVIPPKQPVAFAVIAPSVKPGTKSNVMFTHYSMLKTTEELLGITTFLGNAANATDLRAAFNL